VINLGIFYNDGFQKFCKIYILLDFLETFINNQYNNSNNPDRTEILTLRVQQPSIEKGRPCPQRQIEVRAGIAMIDNAQASCC
jgi:hypothetical protein